MSLAQARADMERFSQGGFSAEILFQTPTGSEPVQSATVKGFNSMHNLKIDSETGQPVNSREAHISVHEQVLLDAGYTVRNSGSQVALKDHRVTLAFADGSNQTFLLDQIFPNDTTGLIVCMIGKLIVGNATNPVIG